MKCMGDFGAKPRIGYKTHGPDDVARSRNMKRAKRGMEGADFGGISYAAGDFVTPGTSGMGDIWSKALKTIFGKEGATQVTTTLQSGATAAVTNIVGSKLGTDPNAQAAIKQTGIDTAKAIFNEYWYITYPATAAMVGIFGYGIYDMIKGKK